MCGKACSTIAVRRSSSKSFSSWKTAISRASISRSSSWAWRWASDSRRLSRFVWTKAASISFCRVAISRLQSRNSLAASL